MRCENFGRYLSGMIHFSTLNFIFGLRTWNVDIFFSLNLIWWPFGSLVALANSLTRYFGICIQRRTKYIHGLFFWIDLRSRIKNISNAFCLFLLYILVFFLILIVETQFWTVMHATICMHFLQINDSDNFPPNITYIFQLFSEYSSLCKFKKKKKQTKFILLLFCK